MPAAIRSSIAPRFGVEADVPLLIFDLGHHHRGFESCVGSDQAGRRLEGPIGRFDSGALVAVELLGRFGHSGACPQQRKTVSGDHALFEGGSSGGERIFDAVFLLLELHLGGCSNLDHGHAAGQFGLSVPRSDLCCWLGLLRSGSGEGV
jgi:hypothetical protein